VNQRVIKGKVVCKVKRGADGSIERYKIRYVAVFRNWAIKWQIAIDFQNPNSDRSFFENYHTVHRPLSDGFKKKSAYTSL
jgi:hypothetical protein